MILFAMIPRLSKKRIRQVRAITKRNGAVPPDHLHNLAFNNSLLPNIISVVSDGTILKANAAACKLLGYSNKELLTKKRKEIFNISESSYIKMIKKRTAKGHVKADVNVIRKNGKQLPCEITSVIFMGDHQIEKSITTLIDMTRTISKQKRIDIRKRQEEIKLTASQIADAVRDAHEEERADIGKELHDNVNQLLTVSRLYLEMGRTKGSQKEMYLGSSSKYILNAIEEIRKLTKGMISDVIKDMTLCEAIEKTIQDAMEIYPIKISCTQDDLIEIRLNDKVKLNIFRIIQEQLTNILKHARASVVNIGLSQNNDTLLLSISDDGVGFDTTQKAKGIGMRNIRSRAEGYNGIAKFTSRPGEGCVLTVRFPITDGLLNKN
jgi:two-component system, NarL family, sensor histidine kinase UhpB